MLEAEISHVDNMDQVTTFTEDMIKFVTRSLVESSHSTELSDLGAGNGNDYLNGTYIEKDVVQSRWSNILSAERWPRMTYTEAIEYLNKTLPQDEQLIWGDSLQLKHERLLAEKSPIFITDYPESQKPFYMLKSANYKAENPTVACFDLLVPEFGELAGGSMREHDYQVLLANMKQENMNIEDMEWYLNLRKQGTIPHGGFGLGFERLISYLAGYDNVRDISAFPRAPELCNC